MIQEVGGYLGGLGAAIRMDWGSGVFGEALDDGKIASGNEVEWEGVVAGYWLSAMGHGLVPRTG